MNPAKSQLAVIVLLLIFELIVIILFAFFVKYHPTADPKLAGKKTNYSVDVEINWQPQYPLFQDIHVMIFIGFGFLMTFLRKYAFSALGFTFLIGAVVIQWAILCHGMVRFRSPYDKIYINLTDLLYGDVAAAVFLISFGAIIGTITPLQLFIMAIIETVVYSVNEYIAVEIFEAADAGGSMYVHAFGAYFGLAVSFVLTVGKLMKREVHKLESSSYESDISAMIGTLFLWVFWPSFTAAFLSGDAKLRAIVNTYLALVGSCVTAFAVSAAVTKEFRFNMVHVQNSTLAGGVCIGTIVNTLIRPYGAIIVGCLAGAISVIGYNYLQEFLYRKLRVHDTCGVHNLHGMPGVLSGLLGGVMAALADKKSYGNKLPEIFYGFGEVSKRSPKQQAAFQIIGLLLTLFVAISGGLLTGALLRGFPTIPRVDFYDDEYWWDMETETEDESED